MRELSRFSWITKKLLSHSLAECFFPKLQPHCVGRFRIRTSDVAELIFSVRSSFVNHLGDLLRRRVRRHLLRIAEYRLCGRSLRTAMPNAFFCPISTSSRLPRVIPRKKHVISCTPEEAVSAYLSHEKLHALGIVLEIHKAVAVVQFHLKQPEHGKPQKTGNLRPGATA